MLDRLPVGAVPLAGSSVVGHARKLADTAQGASQAATAATSAALPFHCKLLLQPKPTSGQYVARRLGPIVLPASTSALSNIHDRLG